MGSQTGHKATPRPFTGGGPIVSVLKAVILALALSVVLLFVAALVLYFTAVPERITPYLVFGTSLVSIFTGSSYAGRKIGHKGWFYGGVTGLLFVILLLLIGLIFREHVLTGWGYFTKLFLGFIFGAAGGMWGVNR